MIKNIYIRKDDEKLWEWAQAEADRKGVPFSKWLNQLIWARKQDEGSGQVSASTPDDLLAEVTSKIGSVRDMLRSES